MQLGSDVEIQQEIRTRMGALGGQVAEAYVGRRIRDRAVEIAFVTLWAGRPVDRPLDEPLWHDVAERYDSYWIEVYDETPPRLTGDGRPAVRGPASARSSCRGTAGRRLAAWH